MSGNSLERDRWSAIGICRQRPGMLLNILQCKRTAPHNKELSRPVNCAEFQKLCCGFRERELERGGSFLTSPSWGATSGKGFLLDEQDGVMGGPGLCG